MRRERRGRCFSGSLPGRSGNGALRARSSQPKIQIARAFSQREAQQSIVLGGKETSGCAPPLQASGRQTCNKHKHTLPSCRFVHYSTHKQKQKKATLQKQSSPPPFKLTTSRSTYLTSLLSISKLPNQTTSLHGSPHHESHLSTPQAPPLA